MSNVSATPSTRWTRPRWLLAALAAWLLVSLGWRPLMLPDEGRYVGVAYEMLRGDGLVPLLHGLPFFHKPPLMYWLDIAAMRLFGVSEFAGRIAPALGAWLMGLALLIELRPRVDARTLAIALGLLATMPFFFLAGQYANHDMLVAGCISLSIACAIRALSSVGRPRLGWLLLAWGAAAFAVLAKGLIGVVLPGLVLLPWLLAQRRWRDLLALLHPLALLLFALIALPWFFAMQARYPAFFDYFVMEQHFRRYATTGFNNAQPFWFFFVAVPLATLPWSLWLPAALRRAWTGRLSAAVPVGLYAWWAFAVLLFFSAPQSKLIGYVLPALVPLAALLALAIAPGRAWRWLLPITALAGLGMVAALAVKAPHSQRELGLALREQLQPGDRVVLVEGAFYDLPFYARLSAPPMLLSDWDDPSIPRRDNWRKEIFDAARFDPQGARERLWRPAQAAGLLCHDGAVWFVAAPDWQPPAALGAVSTVLRGREAQLLRAQGRGRASCP